MYVLKRILACVVDYAIFVIPAAFGLLDFSGEPVPEGHPVGFGLLSGSWMLGSFLVPALILGALTGLTGRTPGKLLFFLRVQYPDGDPPGLAHGILRELAKLLLFATVYGLFYALASAVNNRETFYDNWFGLEVDDLRPYGLTETQKNFRKYMREKQRRERQGRA